MRPHEIEALATAYRSHECPGIAAFITFVGEIDSKNDRQTLWLMVAQQMGVELKKDIDPLVFFTLLLKVREDRPPFVDDGIKFLDISCNTVAQLWEETAHTESL